ncbi:PREDICTED: uncharacterized protein LOC100634434 [Amphimedon queenslandica]|uniref:SAM domain-containing protein n=1 Tax=Amphimedon queenslandica TaxID=400682 RepID=A0A1X7V4G4_AMPQE|nr:PREDICTED: uncharacterized protein LOC100634434 [Amphimedon queenslandica]|eukprot:XP_003385689.1 PREDICTED: uncharacterized protein LOC100634434 [Amphimedon queenslandica]
MATGGDSSIVTTQPKSRRREIEEFVRDLDPLQVADWSEADVVERFLKPVGMEFMAKAFMENKISGPVLIALSEDHMKEMGCAVLGDRILFMEYLQLLKKHKRDADRSRALWSGTTPVLKCAYSRNCGEFMFHLCCPCCVPTTEWRITGQGIRWRRNRAAINCCGDVETQFIDYRFLKDLELRKEPKCCCFCVGKELLIYADDKDATAVRQSKSTGGPEVDAEPVSILHPEVEKAESLIRNAWADSKLVAD